MTSYAKKELARYWPVPLELMAQYRDGSHTKNESGHLEWWKNGKLHRDGDKPACISPKGTLIWYQNGELHRDGDKPARIDANGRLDWFQNDLWHRSHGPAVIRPNGTLEWWINHEEITQEVNAWLAEEEWQGTPEQIFEFQLRFL